jgi:hypothetical protein
MKLHIDNSLCQCGHAAGFHTMYVFDGREYADADDVICGSTGTHRPCPCKQFKLNNLDLIEYMAEKRIFVETV